MPTLDTLSCTLHYRDEGRGEPALVFLHGWCDDASIWDTVLPAFTRGHRCLVPEMRGHGKSGMPADHAFFPEALGNDVLAICHAAGVESPVLVGHSFGGYLAAEIIRRYPEFARAVVIEDQSLDLGTFGLEMRTMESAIRTPSTHMGFREELKRMLLPGGTPAAVVEEAMATGLSTPVDVGLALWAPLFEFTEHELKTRSRHLMAALASVPALVIDRAPAPEYHLALRSHAPEVEIEVMDGSHWIHLEHPKAFVERLKRFLKEVV